MIAASISLMVGVAATSIFLMVLTLQNRALAFNRLNQQTRIVPDYTARDLRQAISVEDSFNQYSSTDSNVLILRIPALGADGYATGSNSVIDTVVYHPDDTNPDRLVREVFPDATSSRSNERRVVGNVSQGLAFASEFGGLDGDLTNATIIHYRFDAEINQNGTTIATPISGSVRLRNAN